MRVDEPVLVRRRVALGSARGRILLLHGMASSATVWDAVIPLCPDDVDVWSADLPWRSDGESSWSHRPGAAEWISLALDGVPGGVDVVVAHSFSAVLMLELLAGARARPRGAVLVSPFYRASPADFRFEIVGTLVANFERAMREGISRYASRPIAESIQAEMARLVCERVGPYGWMRFLDAYLRTPWLDLASVPVPCLTVAGSDDRTAPPAEATLLAGTLPDAYAHVLAGCGHFPMLEQPAAFTAAVSAFLDTVMVPAGTLAEETTP